MNLILCMAGLYRRFREQGYQTEKYLLPWGNSVILDHILRLMLADGSFNDVLLVANRRNIGSSSKVASILARHGVPADRLVYIDDTCGQAETAAEGVRRLPGASRSRPTVFHNIDTLLIGRDYRAIAAALAKADGYIDVFLADSPKYSFVTIDRDHVVQAIAEKRVISNFATSGLYGFRSGNAYLDLVESVTPSGEYYISSIYQAMLDKGQRILVNAVMDGQQTVILGTPEEYEAARAQST